MCALEEDLNKLHNGISTILGERGTTLSGGQKARLSLARAVYSNADVYLLDDPLSAVDAKVAYRLFNNCITKLRDEGKAVVLVTHQAQFLADIEAVYEVKNKQLLLVDNRNGLTDRT